MNVEKSETILIELLEEQKILRQCVAQLGKYFIVIKIVNFLIVMGLNSNNKLKHYVKNCKINGIRFNKNC